MALRTSSYQISNVAVIQARNDLWIIQPANTGWFVPVVGGTLLTVIGLFFLFAVNNAQFFSIFFFIAAAYYATSYPLAAEVSFNFTVCQVAFTATYLLRFPRHTDWCVPFTEVLGLGLRSRPFGSSRTVQLTLRNGTELTMDFGRQVAAGQQLIQRFAAAQASMPVSVANPDQLVNLLSDPNQTNHAQLNTATVTAASLTPITETRARLQRETRSWGTWLIIMGVLQMIEAKGLSPWGVVLLLVGAASFYFQEAAMLVIYAVTIGWAGVLNLMGANSPLWRGFAIVQFVIMITIFRQFWQYRRAEKQNAADALLPAAATRTQRWFPFLTLILGGVALLLFIAAIGAAFILHNRDLLPLISLLETLAINMAVLGVATGLAGWLTIAVNKWVSITGCLAGALTLLAELSLPIIFDALF